MRFNLGMLRVWQGRLAAYVAAINFAMIFYLFIAENKWFPWYIWGIVISLLIITILTIDIKVIWSNELTYTFEKNPEMVKMRENVKKLCEKFDISYED